MPKAISWVLGGQIEIRRLALFEVYLHHSVKHPLLKRLLRIFVNCIIVLMAAFYLLPAGR